MDYGESLEAAAVRAAREEISLGVEHLAQFGAYSDPDRDPGQHTISFVRGVPGNRHSYRNFLSMT